MMMMMMMKQLNMDGLRSLLALKAQLWSPSNNILHIRPDIRQQNKIMIIRYGTVKLSRYAMQARRGRGNSCYSFLLTAMAVSGQHHALAAHYPRERTPGTHCIGGWVGLRDGLNTVAREKIISLLWGSNPDRPVCNYTD
jgi:hypothetical protein